MGTYSYVLLGTEQGMQETFGSTCHGAGRALSRSSSRRALGYEEVLANLAKKGISIRVASPKLVTEEVPRSVLSHAALCHRHLEDVLATGTRIVQRRQSGGRYVSSGRHLQEVHQAAAHRCHQGMTEESPLLSCPQRKEITRVVM